MSQQMLLKNSVPIIPTSTLHVLAGCNKVSLEPFLLQVEQFQHSQPFLARKVILPSDHFMSLFWIYNLTKESARVILVKVTIPILVRILYLFS